MIQIKRKKRVGLEPSIRKEVPRWSYREEAMFSKNHHSYSVFISHLQPLDYKSIFICRLLLQQREQASQNTYITLLLVNFKSAGKNLELHSVFLEMVSTCWCF